MQPRSLPFLAEHRLTALCSCPPLCAGLRSPSAPSPASSQSPTPPPPLSSRRSSRSRPVTAFCLARTLPRRASAPTPRSYSAAPLCALALPRTASSASPLIVTPRSRCSRTPTSTSPSPRVAPALWARSIAPASPPLVRVHAPSPFLWLLVVACGNWHIAMFSLAK